MAPNTLDISGKWSLSRSLSDDPEESMLLQNFGWMLRKAAKVGSVTIVFDHKTAGSPPTLDVLVLPPPGFSKETRTRTIDGSRVEDKHFVFGTNYVVWNNKPKADESLDQYFRDEEWLTDELLEEIIESGDGTFTNLGVWGLIEVEGKKQLVKRAVVQRTDGKRGSVRQVFEWVPE